MESGALWDSFSQLGSETPAFLDSARFAFGLAQIEELGPADLAITDDLKFVDVRRMLRENTFHANAVRYFADCEGFGNP